MSKLLLFNSAFSIWESSSGFIVSNSCSYILTSVNINSSLLDIHEDSQ